ncbi:hypothetical protein L873DRAFT_1304961 [Choiromyces venosus 120613-1]|uniref:Pentacotripeptide-repeat region of PRORP domain-containing protein n=1 Tax=Choiromyces venosus 120613-1 TaxID=1336337 RepID=A0A3N4JE53_9PEZI|nr:hypothetical protein L873DRAFT_1304961 [Choiromyces venosus 120613-1]
MSQCVPCRISSHNRRPIRILSFLAPAVPIDRTTIGVSRRHFSSRESATFVPPPGRANCFLRANTRKQHRPRIDTGPGLRGFGIGLFRRNSSETDKLKESKSWSSGQAELRLRWHLMSSISRLFHNYSQEQSHKFLRLVAAEGRDVQAIGRVWGKLSAGDKLSFVNSIGSFLEEHTYWNMLNRLMEWYCTGTRPPGDPYKICGYFNAIVTAKIPTEKAGQDTKVSRDERRRRADKLIAMLRHIISRRDFKDRSYIAQSVLYKLIINASLDVLVGLRSELRKARLQVGRHTTLHFISRLSDLQTWDEAFSILKMFQLGKGPDLMLEKAWHVFLKMFYQATHIGQEESNEVIQKMLACNITPTTETYNVLMSKAVREGNEDTMKEAFQEMLQAGLNPSMVTYGILHKHYKQVGKQEEQVMVIRDAMMLDKRLNVILASDILHAKVLANASYTEVYMQFIRLFRPGALAALGLTSPARYPMLEKLEPNHYTVAIMMYAFCREDRGLRAAWRMYREYQRILGERTHPHRSVLVKAGSFIPNSFMMALGAHRGGLHYAATVMEEMLQEWSPIKPGVVSWSILLQILVKRGDMAEAEQLVDLMKARGAQPNAVTWTTLLNGYMVRHNLHKTGQIIARMSQMYMQPDRATIDKLTAYLNSQELLGGIRSIEEPEETQKQQQEEEEGKD